MWHNSPFALSNHLMYYINLGRKTPAVWIEVFFCSDSGWIHTSHVFSAHHVAQDPPGAQHQCLHVSPCSGRPGCRLLRYSAPQHRGMLSPAPAALPQLTQNFLNKYSCWSIWEKNTFCVRYTSATQTRCLVSLDLFCSHGSWAVTLTGISIYILKDIHIYFFWFGRCYVAIISFLSAGARTVYSVRHHSCSVLPHWGIKNHNFSTAVISSCLNRAFLSYPSRLLVPSL